MDAQRHSKTYGEDGRTAFEQSATYATGGFKPCLGALNLTFIPSSSYKTYNVNNSIPSPICDMFFQQTVGMFGFACIYQKLGHTCLILACLSQVS